MVTSVATKPVEGVSMKDTLYGQIDSVASGQKQLLNGKNL